jgi:hypothetical protein
MYSVGNNARKNADRTVDVAKNHTLLRGCKIILFKLKSNDVVNPNEPYNAIACLKPF